MTRYLSRATLSVVRLGRRSPYWQVCAPGSGLNSHRVRAARRCFCLPPACSFSWPSVPRSRFTKATCPLGRRIIPWMDIRRLDRTGWISPLIVRVTLFDDSRVVAGLSRRPGLLQQPAAPSAPPFPRRAHRRHPVPAVLGRSSGARQRAQAELRCPATAFCGPRTRPKSSGCTNG